VILNPGLRLLIATLLCLLAGASSAAGTLTVCSEGSPDGFDIAQSESALTHDAAGMTLYDQLLHYKRGTTELVPGLAERWQVSADGLQVTLWLRRGVKFHSTTWFKPTREMNADDVLFSIRRMAEPKTAWQAAAKSGFGMWHSTGMADIVKGIERLDEHRVRLTLKQPNAPFLGMLASSFTASVFSAEYGAQLLAAGKTELMNTQPVGTGPFVLRSYQKDAVIRLAPHPGYWGGASTLDQLVFAITADPQVRIQRLKSGECRVGANIQAQAAGAFDSGDVRLAGGTALLTGYIAINTRRGPLADLRLRQALWLALDKRSLIQSVYAGRAEAAASFLPPSNWSFDASLRERFDPAQARALVKASGYDGRELAIFTRVGGSIDARRAAELMQADWARAGVKSRVQMIEWGEMLKRTGQGEHDITFLNWSGNGDPDDFFTSNLSCAAVPSGGNKSQWCHPAFDALLDAARVSGDRAQRSALYAKAQRIVYDEVPIIPTVYPQYFTAVHRSVVGFVASPLTDLDFRGVSLR